MGRPRAHGTQSGGWGMPGCPLATVATDCNGSGVLIVARVAMALGWLAAVGMAWQASSRGMQLQEGGVAAFHMEHQQPVAGQAMASGIMTGWSPCEGGEMVCRGVLSAVSLSTVGWLFTGCWCWSLSIGRSCLGYRGAGRLALPFRGLALDRSIVGRRGATLRRVG